MIADCLLSVRNWNLSFRETIRDTGAVNVRGECPGQTRMSGHPSKRATPFIPAVCIK